VIDANDMKIYFPNGATAMVNFQISSNGTIATLTGTITSTGVATASILRTAEGQARQVQSAICDGVGSAAGVLGAGVGNVIGGFAGPEVGAGIGSVLGPVGAVAGAVAGRAAGSRIGAFVGAGIFGFAASAICNAFQSPPTAAPSPAPSDGGNGNHPPPTKLV